MARELERDRKAGRARTWAQRATTVLRTKEPVPELWPELYHVVEALSELGQDANGRHLFAEAERWLDANGVADESSRAAYRRLWRALERAASDELRRRDE